SGLRPLASKTSTVSPSIHFWKVSGTLFQGRFLAGASPPSLPPPMGSRTPLGATAEPLAPLPEPPLGSLTGGLIGLASAPLPSSLSSPASGSFGLGMPSSLMGG